MNVLQVLLGVSNLLVGLLGVALAVPLLRGKVRRNAWYGVRFPQSFASDEAWLAINRYGARRLLEWSVAMAVLGGVTLLLPPVSGPLASLPFALALLTVLVPVAVSYRFARRYAAGR